MQGPHVVNQLHRELPVAPTPAVVLAVGRQGAEIAADIEPIFFRGDNRRQAVTHFLALTHTSKSVRLVPVAEALATEGHVVADPGQAYESCVAAVPALRVALEEQLRTLRTSERLLAAGLGDVSAPALDIILIADLIDPWSAGVLVPLLYLVQDLLTHDPYATRHVLLSIALFDKAGDSVYPTRLSAALKELDALLDQERSAIGEQAVKALGLQGLHCDSTLDFHIYLFDQRKEGMREVKDQDELQVIMGNFALALLSGGLARRLDNNVSRLEKQERKAFYSSSGATALVFDPEILANACAARLSVEFIDDELLSDIPPNSQRAGEWASQVYRQLGDLSGWLERLLQNTPFTSYIKDGNMTFNLALSPIDFTALSRQRWEAAIACQDHHWRQNRLPEFQQAMAMNSLELRREVVKLLSQAVDELPQDVRLYPNGLATSVRALQTLQTQLETGLRQLAGGNGAPMPDSGANLAALSQAAKRFPSRILFAMALLLIVSVEAYGLAILGDWLHDRFATPLWLNWLLIAVTCAATTVAAQFYRVYQDRKLVGLRQQCVRNLERAYADSIENIIRAHLRELYAGLVDDLAAAQEQLHRLQSAIVEARTKLAAQQWIITSRTSLFRQSPVNKAFVEQMYYRWRQPPETMRSPLLNEYGLLVDWRKATPDSLVESFMGYGRRAFTPIQALTLREVLEQRPDKELDNSWLVLRKGATPLLRPNFDRFGGGSYAHKSGYWLQPETFNRISHHYKEKTSFTQEKLVSGDVNVVLSCFVRHLIPLIALPSLMLDEDFSGHDSWQTGGV